MSGDKLLVCIAFHYVSDRMKYLNALLERFKSYEMNVHVIVDSNQEFPVEGVELCVHKLQHQYHLTWIHRQHFVKEINNYDWFMYVEDDMDVPFENFKNYTENFKFLWPKYVPSFVRIEKFENKQFITDVINKQSYPVIEINNKKFINLSNPYHAFWIMPKEELKNTMTSNFNRLETHREMGASYPMWELKKTPLVQIENNQISPLCYSYHLPNNYATFSGTPFAKIEINNLLI